MLQENNLPTPEHRYNTHTHHLLGESELKLLRPNAHIMNYSRGELVDSSAMKKLYSNGELTGKYFTDFVDEDLNDEENVIIMPHLGASTGEAEENSASMAADQIRNYLEMGSIVNSVNFPTCELGPVADGTNRICIVNKNVTGVLGSISTVLGESGINILKQVNVSRDDIAYTVIEFAGLPKSSDELQLALLSVDGVLTSRFVGKAFEDNLYGLPGTHYKVIWRDGDNVSNNA